MSVRVLCIDLIGVILAAVGYFVFRNSCPWLAVAMTVVVSLVFSFYRYALGARADDFNSR